MKGCTGTGSCCSSCQDKSKLLNCKRWEGLHCMAQALYDNIAESPDELAFRKGDLLTVLEQNTGGLEGWWLCSLRGRQGICPANRLRLIPRVYNASGGIALSSSTGSSPVYSPHLLNSSGSSSSSSSSSSGSSSGSLNSKQGLLSSAVRANQQPLRDARGFIRVNKVVTPVRKGEVFAYESSQGTYDTLPEPRPLFRKQESYDTPRPLAQACLDYDVPRNHNFTTKHPVATIAEYDVPRTFDTYDSPKPLVVSGAAIAEHYDIVPAVKRFSDRSSGVSLLSSGSSESSALSTARSNSSESLSLSSIGGAGIVSSSQSGRSSVSSLEIYDVPKPIAEVYDIPAAPKPVEENVLYDLPPKIEGLRKVNSRDLASATDDQSFYDVPKSVPVPSLPLELSSAVESIERLENEIVSSTGQLLKLWKDESPALELQLMGVRLRSSLQELLHFAKGTLVNARKLGRDPELENQLSLLIRPLQDANTIVQSTTAILDNQGWVPRTPRQSRMPSEMDQLMACCRNLPQDVHQVTLFIKKQGHNFFAKRRSDESQWIEDYDYVNLESKSKFDEENEQLKQSLPHEMRQVFDTLIRQSDSIPAVLPDRKEEVIFSDSDRNLIEFYGSQVETYFSYLTNAIDAFILTIERNEPPKLFVGYSKFVILSAHKLLCIGDTVHRNVSNAKLKSAVLDRSNKLCKSLQTCVNATKKAGREFPSVTAVQAMLDSVVGISQLARDLKNCIVQAAHKTAAATY